MGIDAEVFVRTRKIHTEEEVRRLAYRPAVSFGFKAYCLKCRGRTPHEPVGKMYACRGCNRRRHISREITDNQKPVELVPMTPPPAIRRPRWYGKPGPRNLR